METYNLNRNSLKHLYHQFPCRNVQINQLGALIDPALPSPQAVVIHGLEAAGKTAVTTGVLSALGVLHAVIRSKECITARHLLEQTAQLCEEAVVAKTASPTSGKVYGRCESLSALVVQLQKILNGVPKFFLMFDGIDRQREAPPTLLSGLARLGEIIPNISTIFVLTTPIPRLFHSTGIPHIHFSPYNREQSLRILSASPRSIFESSPSSLDHQYTEDQAAVDSAWVWIRFCSVVWDSFGKGAASDIVSFRAAADKLWEPFVAPIVEGQYGTRDFSKLIIAKRALFQGEGVLLEDLAPSVTELEKGANMADHDLPYYSKFLLCACYLASYNPARQDPVFFMKSSEKRRRKKGGGTAISTSRAAKHRKVGTDITYPTTHLLNYILKIARKLLGPQVFVLERMLAIFHAILPNDVVTTADIHTQIGTLSSLRLLVKTSATADVLEAQTKWRVNVSWDYIRKLARSEGFEIEDYIAE
ncbi:MAG: hypothetical protein M1829_004098 [Trizodia sp. TS-e1964]|nr:MAG: hypothetical protein M1829_004098 [Trizodia sp. TS-e1964]